MNKIKESFFVYLDIYLFLAIAFLAFLFATKINYIELERYVISNNSHSYSMMDIFINNLKVYMFIILGVFSLGISSCIILFINFLNIFIYFFTEATHTSFYCSINYILRHGILEITGFFMAFSINILFLKSLWKRNFSKIKIEGIFRLVLGIILLFIAAFIEVKSL